MPRIVTLLAAATEIVAAVDAGDELVGVSHECDHPPEVAGLPALTGSSQVIGCAVGWLGWVAFPASAGP